MDMNAKLRFTLALPLIGFWLAWGLFALGVGTSVRSEVALNPATYWFLAGLAVFAAGTTTAFRVSDIEVAARPSAAAKGVLRFSGFMLVLFSVAGAIYAFASFLTAFGVTAENRFLQSYLPIILIALVVVVSILLATVFRKSEAAREADAPKDPRRRALALAWSVPLLGSALALVIAAISFAPGSNPSAWIAVWLFAIIAVAVTLGTHFASKARGLDAPTIQAKQRQAAAGAGRLNFVLMVVFGAVATVYGTQWSLITIDQLTHYVADPYMDSFDKIWRDQLIPSLIFMVLGTGVVYLNFLLRHRDEE